MVHLPPHPYPLPPRLATSPNPTLRECYNVEDCGLNNMLGLVHEDAYSFLEIIS